MTQIEFLNIVTPFKDKVFRLAKRLLVSTEEAEDATQEVLIKLWNNKAKIQEYKNVEAFSMTMTKNYCFDKLKSKQAQNLKIVHSNYEDKQTPLHRQVELNDSVSWVERIIEQLPEQQRMIIQLRDIEEYDMWHSSKWEHIDYIQYIPTELTDTFTQEDLAWAEEKYDSFQFTGIRKQHVELYAALDKEKEVEARSKILKQARTLLRPLERNAANKSVQRT